MKSCPRSARSNDLSEVVVVNLSSPNKNIDKEHWHDNISEFKYNLEIGHRGITSGMIYCLAAIYEKCPFVDFTPSDTIIPKAIQNEANELNVPIAGRDGSTGQTLLKSILAPMFCLRNIEVEGWYSTNVLGNQDGYALSKQEYNRNKMHDKLSGLEKILGYNIDHVIDIKYFPPKGDSKEAWDLIQFKGWLGECMSLRMNWIGKDSVLAAPLILDLTRLMEFSKRNKLGGLQTQLSVYFKNPIGVEERKYYNLHESFLSFYIKYLNNTQ